MPPRRRKAVPEGAESSHPSEPLVAENPAASTAEETQEPASPQPTTRRARRSRRQLSMAPLAAGESGNETFAAEIPPVTESAAAPIGETTSLQAPETVPEETLSSEQPAVSTTRRRRGSSRRRRKTEPEADAPIEAVPQNVEQLAPVQEVTLPLQEQDQAPVIEQPAVEAAEEATATFEPKTQPESEAVGVEAPRRRRARKTTAEGAEPTAQKAARRREGIRLGIRHGHPEIIINGEPVAPLFFFGNVDSAVSERRVAEQVRLAAEVGVHLHVLLLDLPVSVTLVTYSVSEALRLIDMVRQNDPQGYVMLRVMFTPPAGWQKSFPEAMSTFADGSTGEPSFACDRYWQEAQAVLTLLVRQLETSEESERLLGYQLDCREWFYEYQRGYDYSPAAQEAFRQWLRARYKNDIIALRVAWHDGSVTFNTACVPTYKSDPRPQTVLYETRKGQRYVDYLHFASEVVAERIVTLARVVKKNCENRRLVAVSYGYVLDFPVPHSGHLALAEVLSSQSIDLICAPVSYRDRRITQPGSIPVPVGSVKLHGKMFVLEDDTKPHTAQANTPDDYNPGCHNAETTREVRMRNASTALVLRTGISWMDLWGEGWLNDPELWRQAKRLQELYLAYIRQRQTEDPEVVVIVDERSLTRVQAPNALIEPMLLQQQEIFSRAGIHCNVYLQSDLVRRAFPEAQLYIFLNPIQIDADVREVIRERLQRDGKTLVWLYAVALYDEQGFTPDGPREVAGIAIKAQPWNSETGSIITNDRHPITERLRNKQVGTRERVNPSFYSLDERAIVLGEYIQTGLPSITVKDMGTWRSVFIGERQLTIELLRGLCRYAGVHVWSQSNDVVRVAPPFLMVHSCGEGTVQLTLPERRMVYDLVEHRLLSDDTAQLRLSVKTGQSGLYAVGSYEQLAGLGLPVTEKSIGLATNSTGGAAKRRRRGGRKHRKRKE